MIFHLFFQRRFILDRFTVFVDLKKYLQKLKMSPFEDTFDTSPKTSFSSQEQGRTSTHSRDNRSEPPKRLRYWLIDMINSGEILGLHWLDNAHTIFRIPWKHAGKNNWKEEDCKIFQVSFFSLRNNTEVYELVKKKTYSKVWNFILKFCCFFPCITCWCLRPPH